MSKYLVISTVIVVSIVLGGWVLFGQNSGKEASEVMSADSGVEVKTSGTGEEVPDFSLEDYEGETVHLADFTGKPLVINSWAAWCPFCVKELEDFAAVQREFANEVVIVAIDRAESLAVAKKFSDEAGLTDDLVFLLDPDDSFYTAIGGFAMPETLFVTGDGEIQFHKRGPMDEAEIRQRVQALLDR